MRICFVIISLAAAVFLATCSMGSGSIDPAYLPPDMGGASQLPAGNGIPVPNVNAGLTLLQNALRNSGSLVSTSGGPESANDLRMVSPFKGLSGSQSVGAARAYSSVTASVHYTLIPHPGHLGLGVSGSADISMTNWPESTPANGDSVNASMSITQLLTITADHVSWTPGSTPYILSGKEISNIYVLMQEQGVYPTLSQSGNYKIGFGIALTVVDASTGGASAKFILSLSSEGSLTSLNSAPPFNGTLYVYDASTDALIGSMALSGTDFDNLIVFAAGM